MTDCFWANPFGMPFKHVTVSDLVMANVEGQVIHGRYHVNQAAFTVYAARPAFVIANSSSMSTRHGAVPPTPAAGAGVRRAGRPEARSRRRAGGARRSRPVWRISSATYSAMPERSMPERSMPTVSR